MNNNKETFAKIFMQLKEFDSSTPPNRLAVETMKVFQTFETRKREAKVPNAAALVELIERCRAQKSYTEAIRLVGSVFSEPALLGRCFPSYVSIWLQQNNNNGARNLGASSSTKMEGMSGGNNTTRSPASLAFADEMLDVGEVEKLLNYVLKDSKEVDGPAIGNSLNHAMRTCVATLSISPGVALQDPNNMRALLVALEYGAARFSEDPNTLMQTLRCAGNAPTRYRRALIAAWIARADGGKTWLKRLQDTLTWCVESMRAVFNYRFVSQMMNLMDTFNRVCAEIRALRKYSPALKAKIPRPEEFVSKSLAQLAADEEDFLEQDLSFWRQALADNPHGSNGNPRSFCECAWILDTASKAHALQLDADIKQRIEFRDVILRDAVEGGRGEAQPVFVLRVRRDHLVQDTLSQMSSATRSDFRKPLKVQFVGEEGVDAGGVRKEFFLLMMRQLLDPSFGMFRQNPESRTLWFNPDSLESQLQFELVGALMGLAIYNRVILDVSFPRALWKMLLSYRLKRRNRGEENSSSPSPDAYVSTYYGYRGGEEGDEEAEEEEEPGNGAEDNTLGETLTLEDLAEWDPSLHTGLKALLSYDGPDFESVMSRTFQASRESWGTVRTFDLVPGGGEIPVTKENREAFVRAYVRWVFEEDVRAQYEAFERGFHAVLDRRVLDDLQFRPEELELLCVGSDTLDFRALEESARYDDGYRPDSRAVRWLWNVVHVLSVEDKRRFLRFVTGTDRVPIRGLRDVRLVISRNGTDPERLPSAHTCFDHLLLPDYPSEEKLRERLMVALGHSEGFGTI